MKEKKKEQKELEFGQTQSEVSSERCNNDKKNSAQIEVEEMVGEEPNDQMKELEKAHAVFLQKKIEKLAALRAERLATNTRAKMEAERIQIEKELERERLLASVERTRDETHDANLLDAGTTGEKEWSSLCWTERYLLRLLYVFEFAISTRYSSLNAIF